MDALLVKTPGRKIPKTSADLWSKVKAKITCSILCDEGVFHSSRGSLSVDALWKQLQDKILPAVARGVQSGETRFAGSFLRSRVAAVFRP